MSALALVAVLAMLAAAALRWRAVRDVVRGAVWGDPPAYGYFSLERAAASYAQYRALALDDLAQMRRSYARLGRVHKRMGYDLGYPAKLTALEHTTDANAHVAQAIADLAMSEFPALPDLRTAGGDLARVRETMKHFVRDWSSEGADERAAIFAPVLDALRLEPADRRGAMNVLVPGAGLGRLAWEISQLGFDTTANELSYFMTLALRFLLSSATTKEPNQHTVHPYAYWFSHQRTNDLLFRGISFPDTVPRLRETFHLVEGDFMDLTVPKRNNTGYDYIVTLFFIDTSLNVISTLQHIYSLLRPGGTWINLGPLLWSGGAQARVELCLDEVIQLAQDIGFRVEGESPGQSVPDAYRRRTVPCEYTRDKHAMMKWVYQAEFWVAHKPDEVN